MPRYLIEIEAESMGDVEAVIADGRWSVREIPPLGPRYVLDLGGQLQFVIKTGENGAAAISSNLHFDSEQAVYQFGGDPATFDPLQWQHYEGAIDGVESFILAAVGAGLDVTSREFKEALQTTLDAIGNEM